MSLKCMQARACSDVAAAVRSLAAYIISDTMASALHSEAISELARARSIAYVVRGSRGRPATSYN